LISLLVLDVDGCLSDGKITYSSSGEELKSFDVKDGLAIASWIKMGLDVAIITGRESKIVKKRADELGIKYLFQGVRDKLKKLDEIKNELGISYENIAGIGDDLNDYKMLQKMGLSFTPQNGVEDIKDIVDIVLKSRGGEGAVREMLEIILDKYGLKKRFLEVWI